MKVNENESEKYVCVPEIEDEAQMSVHKLLSDGPLLVAYIS